MEDVGARGDGTRDRTRLSGRLDDIAWALLFLMSGAILVVPGIPHPWAAWFIGVGAILVGLNLVRTAMGMRFHVLVAGCGAIAAAAGVGAYIGIDVPILALVLLLIGVLILAEPLVKPNAQAA
jgi:hypothetical protein